MVPFGRPPIIADCRGSDTPETQLTRLQRPQHDREEQRVYGPVSAIKRRVSWAEPTDTAGTIPPKGQLTPDQRCVLVVDDNPGIRRLLVRLLHLNRFTPLEAGSIAEAITSADQHAIAAVILDLQLGTQSGLELLDKLRRDPRYSRTPVLILTGASSISDEHATLIKRYGAQLFQKPISLALLVEHLVRLTRESHQVALA